MNDQSNSAKGSMSNSAKGSVSTSAKGFLDPTLALNSDAWHKANRDISAKILSELIYEELLTPSITGDSGSLEFNNNERYEFRIKTRRFFGFKRVIPETLIHWREGKQLEYVDAYELMLNINAHIGVKADTAAYAVREFSNTLIADVHQAATPRLSNAELLASNEVQIESQLIAHPWIIANKGRLGFSYTDYLNHAPELAKPAKLLWLAVSQSKAQYHGLKSLPYDQLIHEELSDTQLKRFKDLLEDQGLDSEHYLFMPVHPWQWENELISLFARELVQKHIVPMELSDDSYQAQQSIRTFSNLSHKNKRYVKLPISILNTSVYRGLPPERVKIAPTLSQWLLDEVANDPFLKDEARFILLGEIATINYDHPIFSKMQGIPYQFREKLAVIWRESIHTKIECDEQCIPLAALLHLDRNGEPLLAAIIEHSGLNTETWLNHFLRKCLEPLLHVLYKFGFVFSPHGQNAMLILKKGIPTRLAVKDFVDDANLCADPLPEQESLPEALEDILESLEGPILIQWIQSGLFICVFRYLTEILEDHLNYSEEKFWGQVLQVILNYQQRFPELQERFDAFDLLRPVFPKLCLNRVRLLDKGYHDDAERPSAAVASMLSNPLFELMLKDSSACSHPSSEHHVSEPA